MEKDSDERPLWGGVEPPVVAAGVVAGHCWSDSCRSVSNFRSTRPLILLQTLSCGFWAYGCVIGRYMSPTSG